jgi:hypothetical protein
MCRHVDKLDLQKDYSVLRSFSQPTSRYIAPCYYHDDVSILTIQIGHTRKQIAGGFQHIFKRKWCTRKRILELQMFQM